MKAFHLISLLIIFIIKCQPRTERIKNKVCTTNYDSTIDCVSKDDISKKECESLGCCFVNSKGQKKCFHPSYNNGCIKCGIFGNCNINAKKVFI